MFAKPRRWTAQRGGKLGLPLAFLTAAISAGPALAQTANLIGKEISVPVHLQDGKELETSIPDLIAFGEKLFTARWTSQEGQGRPLTKGTGSPLVEPNSPLVFPRNFDRMSGPDSNSCAGCHNTPYSSLASCGAFTTRGRLGIPANSPRCARRSTWGTTAKPPQRAWHSRPCRRLSRTR